MDHFDEFWKVKPKRKGSNPKFIARKSYERLIKEGVESSLIISAARQWAAQEAENKKAETEFVPMAVTWLNQRRFEDYEELSDSVDYALMQRLGWTWNGETWVKAAS